VHYVLRANCSNLGLQTSKYLNREGNYGHFSLKSTNDRVWPAFGLVAKLNTACTMFCAQTAVIWAFKRRNISIGKEITVIFRQNRRMIEFCELLGLFRSLIQCALCSARKIQLFRCLNVEISPTGRKLHSFYVKIDA
jgi:hypothetical protein